MVYRQTERSEKVRAAARERILRAAIKLFGKKGVEATTMQDIVAAAGTSIGNIYFYFGSKDELVREAIESITNELLSESEQRAEIAPPGPARIALMIAFRLDRLLLGKPALTQLLLDTDQRLGTIELMEDIAVNQWLPRLAECLPQRDPDDLLATATAIWGVNRAVVTRIARGRLELDRIAAIEFVLRWTLRGLSVPDPEIETILSDVMAQL